MCVCVCVMGGAALRCRAKTYGCTASPPTAWQSTRQPTGPDTCAAALPPGQQAPCTRSDAARLHVEVRGHARRVKIDWWGRFGAHLGMPGLQSIQRLTAKT